MRREAKRLKLRGRKVVENREETEEVRKKEEEEFKKVPQKLKSQVNQGSRQKAHQCPGNQHMTHDHNACNTVTLH